MVTDILAAPCIWCGYNGPGYWQTGTHDTDCPWHGIGGEAARYAAVVDVVPTHRNLIRDLHVAVAERDATREALRLAVEALKVAAAPDADPKSSRRARDEALKAARALEESE